MRGSKKYNLSTIHPTNSTVSTKTVTEAGLVKHFTSLASSAGKTTIDVSGSSKGEELSIADFIKALKDLDGEWLDAEEYIVFLNPA